MITFLIILLILACAGAGLFLGWTECEELIHKILHSFGRGLAGAGIGFVAGLIILIVLSAIITPLLPNDISNHSINLVSLKNTSETSGSFVLGTGTIEGVEYYYYFYKTRGGYARGKIKAYKAILYENDSEEPQLKWIEEVL